MTGSILARDPETGLFGIAIASRFFAVGSLCPHAAAGGDERGKQSAVVVPGSS